MTKPLRIALVGNPNAGKSTIFNSLTGSNQHTGNWPGKTVEKKSGTFSIDGITYEIVDLPGAYSLHPYSYEETITRDYLALEMPDIVINVVDVTNLERNLYLSLQVLELQIPTIIALNMWDVAEHKKLEFDLQRLEESLGVPIFPVSGQRGTGLDILLKSIANTAEINPPTFKLDYGPEIEDSLAGLQSKFPKKANQPPTRWLGLKALEGDSNFLSKHFNIAFCHFAAEHIQTLKDEQHEDADTIIANQRYSYINELVQQVTKEPAGLQTDWTEKIDKITTHKYFGFPIFLIAMWVVFKLTADISAPYIDWLDGLFNGPLSRWAYALLSLGNIQETWFASLIIDGILAGVGGVLVFVPVLFFLYLALALLENSGYMARAAFVMDRLMNAIGLNGRSFLPMLVGFGCSVPAIYATRTLENRRDRILTALLVPFMSCGARLPVYIFIGSIFFPSHNGLVILGLYILGIVVAIILGSILRKTVLQKQGNSAYLMELPPYRLPTLKSIRRYIWDNIKGFLQNAATLIVVVSIIMWALMAIPAEGDGSFANTSVDQSAFAVISRNVGKIFTPLGFDSWESSGALFTGLIAKEVAISTLAQSHGFEEDTESLANTRFFPDLLEIGESFYAATIDTFRLIPSIVGINLTEDGEEDSATAFTTSVQRSFETSSDGHGGLAALAFLVFILLYTPCMPTIAAFKQEFGQKVMWTSVLGQFALAWVAAFIVFQGGLILGLG